MGLQDLVEGFRRWLDGEEATQGAEEPRPRSKWEDFMVQIAREVEGVMQREMFTPPGGPTYIPREYIVFLSPEDDGDWQGEKREGLERGLHYVLSHRAAQLSGTTEFQTSSFVIELRTDGTLERNAFRVQPVWDKTSDRTMVKPRSAKPEPAPHPTAEAEDDSTIVRPRALASTKTPQFVVSVSRESATSPHPKDEREFFKSRITIGRGSKQTAVDLRLEGDLEVSRHHASLERQGETFVVTCEGRNSIFVDVVEVNTGESAAVGPGQKIAICSFLLSPRPPEIA